MVDGVGGSPKLPTPNQTQSAGQAMQANQTEKASGKKLGPATLDMLVQSKDGKIKKKNLFNLSPPTDKSNVKDASSNLWLNKANNFSSIAFALLELMKVMKEMAKTSNNFQVEFAELGWEATKNKAELTKQARYKEADAEEVRAKYAIASGAINLAGGIISGAATIKLGQAMGQSVSGSISGIASITQNTGNLKAADVTRERGVIEGQQVFADKVERFLGQAESKEADEEKGFHDQISDLLRKFMEAKQSYFNSNLFSKQ